METAKEKNKEIREKEIRGIEIRGIEAKNLDPKKFIDDKIKEIQATVGEGTAVNALSGGVDSSVVTLLGHQSLGNKLKTYFIDNGLMRKKEPEQVILLFKGLGIPVELIDAKEEFLTSLKDVTGPEEKREAITQTFYKDVFAGLVKASGAKYLLQGTILTDVEETSAGIKRQHNVFKQIGINPEEAFGYQILEPLIQLRKDGVRKVAEALGLPESVYNRIPFLGPGLAGRIIGEATPERIKIVREANFIVESYLEQLQAEGVIHPFQYMAILHEDRVTGMRKREKRDNYERDLGRQIEVRCWDSIDARTATPTKVPHKNLRELAEQITAEVEGVVSVTYNITEKPPSTIEAV